jgi:hypothetical protein
MTIDPGSKDCALARVDVGAEYWFVRDTSFARIKTPQRGEYLYCGVANSSIRAEQEIADARSFERSSESRQRFCEASTHRNS